MSPGRDQEYALVYVLRLWRVTDGERLVWRASLQDVCSGKRRGFANLAQVCRFLRTRIEAASGGLPHEGTPPMGRT